GHRPRGRVRDHGGPLLRRVRRAPSGMAAARHSRGLAGARRDGRPRRRVPGPDAPLPVGTQRVRDRRQRDGGPVLGHRRGPGQDVGVPPLRDAGRRRGDRARAGAGAGQGGPRDGIRAGHHRLGGGRGSEPQRWARIGPGRGPRDAHLRRAAQRVAPDPGGDLLRPADRRAGGDRDRGHGPAHGPAGQVRGGEMRLRKRACLAVAVAGVVAGLGCAGGGGGGAASPGASPSAATKKYRFAVIPKSLDLPVFNYARVGAERKAKELGNVEILWRGPETADQLRQKEILESFITQGVDGIAISSLNGDFLTETIDGAIAAGIPVVTWDADAPKSKRLAFYGVDDVAAGRIMGDETARLLGDKGKVAVITSVGAVNLQRRLDGVRESL